MWRHLRCSMGYLHLQKPNFHLTFNLTKRINISNSIQSHRSISKRAYVPAMQQFGIAKYGRTLAIPIVNKLSIMPLVGNHLIEDSTVFIVLPPKQKELENKCMRQGVSKKKKKCARRTLKNKKSHMAKIKRPQKRFINPMFKKDILTLVKEADIFCNKPFKVKKNKQKK